MNAFLRVSVRSIDRFNRLVGIVSMYLVFLMVAILVYSSVSKAFRFPANWTLESAQFTMAAYYMLGGAWAMQMRAHVRMDLFYGQWSRRRRAGVDVLTSVCVIGFLGFLLYGGFSSTAYAIQYGEKSYSSWAPYMAPIKIIMTTGVALMLLQAVSFLLKDIAAMRGESIA